MKKRLSLFLALLLVATTIFGAIPTFAADAGAELSAADQAAVAGGKKFKIGDTYYEHLRDASHAVTGGETIYQLADYTMDGRAHSNYDFTLDGQGYTITNTIQNTLTIGGTTTLQNVTIKTNTSAIMWNPQKDDAVLTLDNVTGMTTANPSGNAYFLLVGSNYGHENYANPNGSDGKVVIKDCNISGAFAPFYVGGNNSNTANADSSFDIDIINSTLENTYAHATWPYAVLLYWASYIDLTVDGTSKLLVSSNNANATSVIQIGSSTSNAPKKCSITLCEGAELGLTSANTAPAASFILRKDTTKGFILNDQGAKYTASAYMQGKGVTLPTVGAVGTDKVTAGGEFKSGSTTVANGAKYTNASASASVTFAFAGGTRYTEAQAKADGNIFRSGMFNYYKTLDAALKGELYGTIYMIDNYSLTGRAHNNKSVVIDGQGYVLTNTVENGITISGTTTLKNITIKTNTSAILWNPQKDTAILTLDNVTGMTTNNPSKAYFLAAGMTYGHENYATPNGSDGKIVIKDCNISGAFAPFYVGANLADTSKSEAAFDIDIINSTLQNTYAHATWPYVALLYWAASIDLTVDSTSKLLVSSNNTVDSSVIQIGSNASNAPKKTSITLMKGAELGLISESNAPAGEYIRVKDTTKTLTVKDQGAKYSASAYMQKKGVALPKNTTGDIIGYSTVDTLYTADYGTYTNASATEAITFEALTFDANDFANKYGASIRTANDAYAPAIRFTANVAKSFYEKVSAYAIFGTLVTLTENITDGDIAKASNKLANEISVWAVDGDNDVWSYNTAIFNIPAADYETSISATAYFTVTYHNGTTATFYADYSADNARSLYQVAKSAYNAGTTDNDQINTIIGSVEGSFDAVAASLAVAALGDANKTVNAGDGSVEMIWTSNASTTKYDALCADLEEEGYELYAENELECSAGTWGFGKKKITLRPM